MLRLVAAAVKPRGAADVVRRRAAWPRCVSSAVTARAAPAGKPAPADATMLLPSASLRFDLAPEEIGGLTNALVEQLRQASQDVLDIPPEKRTISNTIEAWHLVHGSVATVQCQATLPAMVSVNKEKRAAALKAKELLKAVWDEEYSRPDLYEIFSEVRCDPKRSCSILQRRLIEHTLRRFRQLGAALPPETRARYRALRSKISSLEFEFQQNINEDTTTVEFTRDELAGCSEHFLASLPTTADGRLVVAIKPPQVLEIMQNAAASETRRRLVQLRDNRCRDSNMALLLEVLHARQEAAELAGFSSHAAYRLSSTMAATPEAAETLLYGAARNPVVFPGDAADSAQAVPAADRGQARRTVLDGLRTAADKELARLAQLKAEHLSAEAAASVPLHLWDVAYYVRELRDRDAGVKDSEVQEYFPLDHVRDAIFKIYEELLWVRIAKLDVTPAEWNNAIVCYAVWDVSPTQTDNLPERPTLARRTRNVEDLLLGYFYLDLYPREGKYSHQCVVPVCPTYRHTTGRRQPSVAANLSNFPRPTPDGQPALLHHSQVETFFHEFGHVMHCMCTRTDYSLFSWAWNVVPYPAGVEHDFLEVPSQALENWVWEESVLRMLSHHVHTGAPMPKELAAKLAASRRLGESIRYRRQIFLSLLDLELHSTVIKEIRTVEDLQALYDKRHREIVGMDPVPDTAPLATFYHICSGYDAGYYGYLWSEVYASDIFAKFKDSPDGCFDTLLGLNYRRNILEPGATRDGKNMLKSFLGREPSTDAFLRLVIGQDGVGADRQSPAQHEQH